MPAKLMALKATFVDKEELKKSPLERQAETLLRRLDVNKAIEIELDGTSSRTVRRVFSKAASNLGLAINLKTKDERVYVVLKPRKAAGQDEVS